MVKDNDIFDEEVVEDAPKPKVEKISLKVVPLSDGTPSKIDGISFPFSMYS